MSMNSNGVYIHKSIYNIGCIMSSNIISDPIEKFEIDFSSFSNCESFTQWLKLLHSQGIKFEFINNVKVKLDVNIYNSYAKRVAILTLLRSYYSKKELIDKLLLMFKGLIDPLQASCLSFCFTNYYDSLHYPMYNNRCKPHTIAEFNNLLNTNVKKGHELFSNNVNLSNKSITNDVFIKGDIENYIFI